MCIFDSYDELDPGIREVVRALRDAGYNTIDSGDGVSKKGTHAEGEYLDFPHVLVLSTLSRASTLGETFDMIEAIATLLLEKTGQPWVVDFVAPEPGSDDMIFMACLAEERDGTP